MYENHQESLIFANKASCARGAYAIKSWNKRPFNLPENGQIFSSNRNSQESFQFPPEPDFSRQIGTHKYPFNFPEKIVFIDKLKKLLLNKIVSVGRLFKIQIL